MKILVATENYFASYGGPYYAISGKLLYLFKKNISFKLIYKRTDKFDYSLDLGEIIDDFDIVHIYGIWRPFHVKIFYISKYKSKKIIISPLGALEPWALSQKKIKKKLAFWTYQKKILNSCDLIHATSEIEKKNIEKIGITTKISVVPHGIEIAEKKKKKINCNKIKKAIFFSRIHKKKGLLELVDAWSEIKLKNWKLDIYGPVSDKNYFYNVKQKIKKLNLENDIKIYDPVFNLEKKKKIFLTSDCFLLPSRSENFGISIGEALAYGLPVLTTTETPWYDIKNSNAGLIIEMNQTNLTINLKIFLSKSEDEFFQMGLNGQKLIEDKYNYNIIIEKYINLYKGLI